jgi:nickel-type superoxide dismutase
MTQLITDLKSDDQKKATHDIARMTHVKEEHAGIIEEELETLRNDYFKEEHYKQYPNLQNLFTDTLKLVSKVRQNIDISAADEVLAGVLQIAEIFYKTKGVEPVRIKSVYPTDREMVFYK